MPDLDEAVSVVRSPEQLAEEFARDMGWTAMPAPAAARGASGDAGDAPEEARQAKIEQLADALADRRPAEVAWWRLIAECWQAFGLLPLAERCASEAHDLVNGGARFDWDDLIALAAIPLAVRAAAGGGDGSEPAGMIGADQRSARRKRLATIFAQRTADANRALDPAAVSNNLETDVLGAHGSFSPALAQGFYLAGEYRLVVEQFLAEICGRNLLDWRADRKDELIWCGRSLLRLGDRASAYACFALAVGSDPDVKITKDKLDEEDTDQLGVIAAQSAIQLRGSVSLDSADEFQVFADGARLAHWLRTRRLEGVFPEFADRLRSGALRSRPAVLARQMSWVSRESGWFVPLDPQAADQSNDYRGSRLDKAGLMPQARPAPSARTATARRLRQRTADDRNERIRTRTGWRKPAPVVRRPGSRSLRPAVPASPAVQVPIGLRADGRTASLPVAPGSRIMLIGPPFTGALLATIGEHLCDAGWSVVLIKRPRTPLDGDYRGWQRLVRGAPSKTIGPLWSPALSASAPLRAAVLSSLTALLPECSDPAASACLVRTIDALLDSRVSAVFGSDDREWAIKVACWVVDKVGSIRYDDVGDLRRAVILVDYVRTAMAALGRAVWGRWETPHDGGRAAAPAVCLEVPVDDEVCAGLRLTIAIGALLEAAAATANLAEEAPRRPARGSAAATSGSRQPDDVDDVIARFETETLQVRLRSESIDEKIQQVAEKAANRTPSEAAAPSAPASNGNPWADNAVIRSDRRARICLIVDGSVEIAQRVFDEWLGDGFGRHALIAAASTATPGVLAACPAFAEFLIGSLPADQRTLFGIVTGVRIPSRPDQDLGLSGAVRVDPGGRGGDGEQLVVWPVRPAAWSAE